MSISWRLKLGVVLGMATAIHLTGAAQSVDSNKIETGQQRFIVVTKEGGDSRALRAEIATAGGTIVRTLDQIGTFVVSGPPALRSRLAQSSFADGVAADHIMKPGDPGHAVESRKPTTNRPRPPKTLVGDPAFTLQGLLWNFDRIHAHEAWVDNLGSPAIKVGVVDTGIDFTHTELASQVIGVVDFTVNENPPICKTFFPNPIFPGAPVGASDADLAAFFSGPPLTDWNGHGTWIGGTIAAALNGNGMNGIAPRVSLVSLKVSQWCEASYDSTILEAILYAADHGIDVINISFGDYRDLTNADERLIYKQYVAAVKYAKAHGTTIVSSAGNDHVRIEHDGRVTSHGRLTTPGSPLTDLFGLFQVPGGVPGVIDVSATVNVVNAPSTICPPGTTGTPDDEFAIAGCKPRSDRHQPFGVGLTDQLTYYSNYGPRIDVAAPGGARKFNVPGYDRGGTPGWPWTTDDGFNAWEAFSTTSNWSIVVPCFLIVGPEFLPDQCYSSLQGTSMAAPHATAAVALLLSERPEHRRKPEEIAHELREGAIKLHHNKTPALSATDKSTGDLSGVACPTGYCHLGGPAIPDHEAFGEGLVDVRGKDKHDKDDHHDDDHDDDRQ